ncbi:MAG TPA: urease accessory UreF family protein [Nitrososphaeraceae archaeon]|jgi:urease accessory protein
MNTNFDPQAEEINMLQLSDSFFPTGMYTTSSGLESLFYSKSKIKTPDELKTLITVYLENQIGPADCTALGVSYSCIESTDIDELIKVDQTIFSMKLIEEVRNASVRSGTQLLRCVNYFLPGNEIIVKFQDAIKRSKASGVYPVSLAVASYSLGISKYNSGIMMLYSFTVSIIGAALRLGMIQHLDGQKLIHDLKPSILATVAKNINRPLSSMWQFTPGIDIIQIAHELMPSKMFIT